MKRRQFITLLGGAAERLQREQGPSPHGSAAGSGGQQRVAAVCRLRSVACANAR
jgi:hypothetical protein